MEDDQILQKLRKKKNLTIDEAVFMVLCPNGNTSEDEELSDADDEINENNVNVNVEVGNLDEEEEHNQQDISPSDAQAFLSQNNVEISDEAADTSAAIASNVEDFRWRNKTFSPLTDTEWKDTLLVDEFWETKTPLEYFYSIFEEELFGHICTQSNIYALQKDGTEIGLTVSDIKTYVGILLKMGILHPPYYRYFWRNSSSNPSISNAMGRQRFDSVKKYLHFNNNANEQEINTPNYDKLFKIRPVIDAIRKKCNEIDQEEYQSVDEQIIPTKSRSSLKQYLPNKPHKWGYKVISRAGQSGIIYDFEMYTGKNDSIVPQDGLGISSTYVMRLSEGIPNGKNYKLFYDNWFSSVPLAVKLYERGILSLATIRANRLKGCILKEEKDLKKEGRGCHDSQVETTNNIIAIKWFDNKAVHVISTYAGINPLDTCRWWDGKAKCYITIERPFAIKEYNSFMGGVDLSDMLIMLYKINFKSRKWYMRIFYFFLDLAVVNAWLIYRRVMKRINNNRPLRLVDFKEDISEGLLQAPQPKRGRPSQSPATSKKRQRPVTPAQSIRYDSISHLPEYSEKRLRCKLCIQGQSRIKCSKCNVGLCITKEKDCFIKYHTK